MLSAHRLAKEPWLREQIPATPKSPPAAGRPGLRLGMHESLFAPFSRRYGLFAAGRSSLSTLVGSSCLCTRVGFPGSPV